eukprot:230572-Prorocentrum_minimum.AAC.1
MAGIADATYQHVKGEVLADGGEGGADVDVPLVELHQLLVSDVVLCLEPLHSVRQRVHRHQQLADDLLVHLRSVTIA